MKSTVENLEGNKVKLSVEVDATEFADDLETMFRQLAKELKLPGFRKGKAPRSVIEARLGKEYTRRRTLEESLPKYCSQAIADHQVEAIAAPEVDIKSEIEDDAVVFDMVVEVRPEVSVAGYASLRVEIPPPAPTEDEIAEEINRFRGHFGTLEQVGRPAIEKDRVTVDLRATYNGETFEPFEASDYVYEVGSGSTGFEDFDKNLIGSQAGQIFDLNVPHPEVDGDLIRIKTLVKDVQENKLPAFTDEFATESTEFDTVEELRADFTEKLTANKREQVARLFGQKMEDALVLLVEEPLSEALIRQATQEVLQNLMLRLQSAGLDLERYLEVTRQTPEAFTEMMRAEGEKQAKLDVALRAVAAAEEISVSDEEVYEVFDRAAAMESQGGAGEASEGTPRERPPVENLKGLRTEMLKREAFMWVCRQAEIVDADGTSIEYAELFPKTDDDDVDSDADDDDDDDV